MATITISRQFGSHGDTVAQLLCDRLGYRYFDKNLMLGLAVNMGLKPEHVVDIAGEQLQARSLIERLFASFVPPMGAPGVWAATAEAEAQERIMMERINQLILAAYQEGNVVIIGRGGQFLLQGKEDVLSVRLVAPLELRIQCHQKRAGLTIEAAREQVVRRDQASADYVNRFFNVDLTDPFLYHMIINTGKVTPSFAADLIIHALKDLTSNR